MNRLAIIFLLALAAPASAQGFKPKAAVKFPMVVMAFPANETAKLTPDMLYVIESNDPHLILASPNGVVKITEEVGPLRIRGRFLDGSGKPETRTYTAKQIWIVEAVVSGKAELLVIPAGATKAEDVTRKTIEVDGGQGPQPPPDPPKKLLAHVTFIGAEKTPVSLATNNDAFLRKKFADAGVKVHVLKDGDPGIAAAGLGPAVQAAGGVPCVVLQEAAGNVIGQVRMGTTADVLNYCRPFMREE